MSIPNSNSLSARSKATLNGFEAIISLWSSKRQQGITLLDAFERSTLEAQHDVTLASGDQARIADTGHRCELVLKAVLKCYASKSNGRSRKPETTNSDNQADGASSQGE